MNFYHIGLGCFIILSLGATRVFGQHFSISGRIIDYHGLPVEEAFVIVEGANFGVVSDKSGSFYIKEINKGKHFLIVSHISFASVKQEIILANSNIENLAIMMEERVKGLEEVVISGKSETTEIRELPMNVSVLDAKRFQVQSASTADLLARVTGVRVRQEGGYGSNANFSVNGISGKQIKFFIDGIPANVYGQGMGLNVLPVNLIERVEIYKGVVPVGLGADALGGAFNVVTKQNSGNFLEGSYGFGSFNTHKASIAARRYLKGEKIYIGANGFYSYSDNNYPIDVAFPSATGTVERRNVRKFHDRFSNHLGRVELGLTDTRLADHLRVSFLYSGKYDEIQNGIVADQLPGTRAMIAQPFGQAAIEETSKGLFATYEKRQILKNLDVDAAIGYNKIEELFSDTTSNVYNWLGQVIRIKDYGGEISSAHSLRTTWTRNAIGRVNLRYSINGHHKIQANVINSYVLRNGEDPLSLRHYRKDPFKNDMEMFKTVAGIAYETQFSHPRITSATSLKHFYYNASGFGLDGSTINHYPAQIQRNWGANQAFKLETGDHMIVKASYEYAARLPDELELFGDFSFVRPNLELQPEIGHNLNLGSQFKTKKLNAELNAFYRNLNNFIFLRPTTFRLPQYQNLLKAEIKGVEAQVDYNVSKGLTASFNATYQDLRNKSSRENAGVATIDYARYYNARVPNIPYLFSNFSLAYALPEFNKNNSLQVWWNSNYVHQFYLHWATEGRRGTKAQIPTQLIHSAGVSYSLMENSLVFSLEGNNLMDAQAFDNFSIQRPGRAYSFKITFTL